MDQEPNWTKQISSEQVCTFFYAFFIIYVVLGVLGLTSGLWSIFVNKMPSSIMLPLLIQLIIQSSILFVSALFHYLVCQRALLSKE